MRVEKKFLKYNKRFFVEGLKTHLFDFIWLRKFKNRIILLAKIIPYGICEQLTQLWHKIKYRLYYEPRLKRLIIYIWELKSENRHRYINKHTVRWILTCEIWSTSWTYWEMFISFESLLLQYSFLVLSSHCITT